MSTPLVYQIRVKGHLDETWMDWFSRLVIVNEENGEATLTGEARDQAELAGVLNRIFDLNLTLLAVNRITDPAE
jgi:hypothetical protein